jgi:uncharacterized protein (DUF1015 family)
VIGIVPISRALVPVDHDSAARISAPNYDEFQSDGEIWEHIRAGPESILRVTMAHCDAPALDAIGVADSPEALRRAAANMLRVRASARTRELRDLLYVYQIDGPARPGVRQIGLGGLARTDQIRTDRAPNAPIIRNEGIREPKARGRAALIEATDAIVGVVNHAVPDDDGTFAGLLEGVAGARAADLTCRAEDGFVHSVWLIEERDVQDRLTRALARQPEAYVADGNHRSAAAAMLGREHFLAVFFPMERMSIRPYNRLLDGIDPGALDEDVLGRSFAVAALDAPGGYQPGEGAASGDGEAPPGGSMHMGLYDREAGWRRLTPHPGTYDPADAARAVAHAVAQRLLFAGVLGIEDERDERIRYVGANRDASWLAGEVDAGRAQAALTLPPVTIEEFAAVCRQGAMMPPKSTWFSPKIRSGLVMALLD